MKGFDDHLDNYGDPGPGDDWYPGSDPDEDDGLSPVSYYGDSIPDDDGITTDDFDHWPNGREFPS